MRRAVIIILLCGALWTSALAGGPIVDRYGQARRADGPRVTKDQDLRADVAAEEAILKQNPASKDYDQYGGYLKAGWREKPTGFFRIAKHTGYWWLITPQGNPCFYLGVDVFPAQVWETTPVTGREGLFAGLPGRKDKVFAPAWSKNEWGVTDGTEYYCHYTANLIRKYGKKDWRKQAEARGLERLRAWGFSGAGKWSTPGKYVYAPVLDLGGFAPARGMPDINNPFLRAQIEGSIRAQVAPHKNDPRLLGWSVGNEAEMIVTKEHVLEMLKLPADTPAKVSLIDYAVVTMYDGSLERLKKAWKVEAPNRVVLYGLSPTPPEGEVEKLRRFLADRFYDLVYKSVKEADPNHLYLGSWIMPEVNAADWDLMAKHCDVIGYDLYARTYDRDALERLERGARRPAICGEFSFPPYYGGQRGFGRFWVPVKDDKEAGELYGRWVKAAAQDPYCVGLMWFQYHDQPITGRGPGRGGEAVYGENYAEGLITVTDRPKWDLVTRVREANLQAARWRMEASRKPLRPPMADRDGGVPEGDAQPPQ